MLIYLKIKYVNITNTCRDKFPLSLIYLATNSDRNDGSMIANTVKLKTIKTLQKHARRSYTSPAGYTVKTRIEDCA